MLTPLETMTNRINYAKVIGYGENVRFIKMNIITHANKVYWGFCDDDSQNTSEKSDTYREKNTHTFYCDCAEVILGTYEENVFIQYVASFQTRFVLKNDDLQQDKKYDNSNLDSNLEWFYIFKNKNQSKN